MKRVILAMLITVFLVMPVLAGGPDITKRSRILKPKTSLVKERPMIEPLIEKPLSEETIEMAVQPSDRGVTSVTEKAMVAAQDVQTKKVVSVLFESSPPTAELIVNGLYVGTTPVQISLHEGVHFVRVLLPGHKMWERQVKAFQGLRVFSQLETLQEAPLASTTP